MDPTKCTSIWFFLVRNTLLHGAWWCFPPNHTKIGKVFTKYDRSFSMTERALLKCSWAVSVSRGFASELVNRPCEAPTFNSSLLTNQLLASHERISVMIVYDCLHDLSLCRSQFHTNNPGLVQDTLASLGLSRIERGMGQRSG